MWPFKRQELPKPNIMDAKRHDRYNAVMDAWKRLDECVEQVIIKQGVVSLYPSGPDKDAAVKAYEKAQYSLLCAIGNYDGRKNEYDQFCVEHKKEDFVTTSGWPTVFRLTSHDIIEMRWKDFLKKG